MDTCAGRHAPTSHRLTTAGGPEPAYQMLLYPATDLSHARPSRSEFASGFMLTEKDINWLYDAYAATTPRTDPALSPLHATCTADLVPVRHAHVDTLIHGYLAFAGLGRDFHEATVHAAHAVRDGVSTRCTS